MQKLRVAAALICGIILLLSSLILLWISPCVISIVSVYFNSCIYNINEITIYNNHVKANVKFENIKMTRFLTFKNIKVCVLNEKKKDIFVLSSDTKMKSFGLNEKLSIDTEFKISSGDEVGELVEMIYGRNNEPLRVKIMFKAVIEVRGFCVSLPSMRFNFKVKDFFANKNGGKAFDIVNGTVLDGTTCILKLNIRPRLPDYVVMHRFRGGFVPLFVDGLNLNVLGMIKINPKRKISAKEDVSVEIIINENGMKSFRKVVGELERNKVDIIKICTRSKKCLTYDNPWNVKNTKCGKTRKNTKKSKINKKKQCNETMTNPSVISGGNKCNLNNVAEETVKKSAKETGYDGNKQKSIESTYYEADDKNDYPKADKSSLADNKKEENDSGYESNDGILSEDSCDTENVEHERDIKGETGGLYDLEEDSCDINDYKSTATNLESESDDEFFDAKSDISSEVANEKCYEGDVEDEFRRDKNGEVETILDLIFGGFETSLDNKVCGVIKRGELVKVNINYQEGTTIKAKLDVSRNYFASQYLFDLFKTIKLDQRIYCTDCDFLEKKDMIGMILVKTSDSKSAETVTFDVEIKILNPKLLLARLFNPCSKYFKVAFDSKYSLLGGFIKNVYFNYRSDLSFRMKYNLSKYTESNKHNNTLIVESNVVDDRENNELRTNNKCMNTERINSVSFFLLSFDTKIHYSINNSLGSANFIIPSNQNIKINLNGSGTDVIDISGAFYFDLNLRISTIATFKNITIDDFIAKLFELDSKTSEFELISGILKNKSVNKSSKPKNIHNMLFEVYKINTLYDYVLNLGNSMELQCNPKFQIRLLLSSLNLVVPIGRKDDWYNIDSENIQLNISVGSNYSEFYVANKGVKLDVLVANKPFLDVKLEVTSVINRMVNIYIGFYRQRADTKNNDKIDSEDEKNKLNMLEKTNEKMNVIEKYTHCFKKHQNYNISNRISFIMSGNKSKVVCESVACIGNMDVVFKPLGPVFVIPEFILEMVDKSSQNVVFSVACSEIRVTVNELNRAGNLTSLIKCKIERNFIEAMHTSVWETRITFKTSFEVKSIVVNYDDLINDMKQNDFKPKELLKYIENQTALFVYRNGFKHLDKFRKDSITFKQLFFINSNSEFFMEIKKLNSFFSYLNFSNCPCFMNLKNEVILVDEKCVARVNFNLNIFVSLVPYKDSLDGFKVHPCEFYFRYYNFNQNTFSVSKLKLINIPKIIHSVTKYIYDWCSKKEVFEKGSIFNILRCISPRAAVFLTDYDGLSISISVNNDPAIEVFLECFANRAKSSNKFELYDAHVRKTFNQEQNLLGLKYLLIKNSFSRFLRSNLHIKCVYKWKDGEIVLFSFNTTNDCNWVCKNAMDAMESVCNYSYIILQRLFW